MSQPINLPTPLESEQVDTADSLPTPPLRFQRSIDVKGRIMIPEEIRELLGESFASYQRLSHGEVLLYPESGLTEINHQLVTLAADSLSAESRALKRLFFSRLREAHYDTLGRVNINPHLPEQCQLPIEATISWDRARRVAVVKIFLLSQADH